MQSYKLFGTDGEPLIDMNGKEALVTLRQAPNTVKRRPYRVWRAVTESETLSVPQGGQDGEWLSPVKDDPASPGDPASPPVDLLALAQVPLPPLGDAEPGPPGGDLPPQKPLPQPQPSRSQSMRTSFSATRSSAARQDSARPADAPRPPRHFALTIVAAHGAFSRPSRPARCHRRVGHARCERRPGHRVLWLWLGGCAFSYAELDL
jgi:hypothetical protein